MESKNIQKLDEHYKSLVGDKAYNDKNVTIKSITKDYSSQFDTLQICFLSDMHIGSSDFDIKGLTDTLTYANSQENAIIFILGDALNTAIIGSKSDAYEDILNPQEQLDIFSEFLNIAKGHKELTKALKNLNETGKIVVLHSGNHEDRINKAVGVSTTKMAADIAGVGDVFAPYFASTDLVLRQPLAKDGKFTVKIVSHHGTGLHNIDGVVKLLRNVDNADICVIGHTHQQSMKLERLIKVNEEGKQEYHDVVCLSLPASGGGTYGAGMSLPDINKQTAVWMEVRSQSNPFAGKISPTGVTYPEIVPACAFFTPSNKMDTSIKEKRLSQAREAISTVEKIKAKQMQDAVDAFVGAIGDYEKDIRDAVAGAIKEPRKRKPKGFDKYLEFKQEDKEMGD